MVFVSLLFFAGVSIFGGLSEGLVWVTASFEFFLALGFGIYLFSPISQGFNYTQIVFQGMVIVNSGVPISLWGFSVDLNGEISVLRDLNCTVQKVQTGCF